MRDKHTTLTGMPAVGSRPDIGIVDNSEAQAIAAELLFEILPGEPTPANRDLYNRILGKGQENFFPTLHNSPRIIVEDATRDFIIDRYIKEGLMMLSGATRGMAPTISNSKKYQTIYYAIQQFAYNLSDPSKEKSSLDLSQFVKNHVESAKFDEVIPMRPMQAMQEDSEELRSQPIGIRTWVLAAVLALTLKPEISSQPTPEPIVITEEVVEPVPTPEPVVITEEVVEPVPTPEPIVITEEVVEPESESLESNPVLSQVDISTLEIVSQLPGALITDPHNLTSLSVSDLEGISLNVITLRDGLKTYDQNGARILPNLPLGANVTATGNTQNFAFADPRTGVMTEATFVEFSYNDTTRYSFAGYFAVQDSVSESEPTETFLDSIFESEDTLPTTEITDKMQNNRSRKMFNTAQTVTYTTENGVTSNYELIGTETVTNRKSVEFQYVILRNPQTGLQIRVNRKTLEKSPNRLLPGELIEDAIEIEDIELIPMQINENVNAVIG